MPFNQRPVIDRYSPLFDPAEPGNYYEVKLVEDGKHARFKRIYNKGGEGDLDSNSSNENLDPADILNDNSIMDDSPI